MDKIDPKKKVQIRKVQKWKKEIVPINASKLNSTKENENKEKYDPTTLPNWENTSNDGDRFAPQQSNFGSGNKSLDSYDSYLKKKAIRETAKKAAKQKVEDLKKTVPNPHTIIV